MALLGKSFYALFWMRIIGIIIGFLTSDDLLEVLPTLYLQGKIVDVCHSIVYIVIFWKLADVNDRYQKSGLCYLGLVFLEVLAPFISEESAWRTIEFVLVMILGLVECHNTYTAHAEVMEPMNGEVAAKWHKIRKWYVRWIWGILGSVVAIVIIPVIGLLMMLGASIGGLIVEIIELKYLNQSIDVTYSQQL